MVTAEERLATRAFSTCTLTIGRARSQLHNARGLHTNTIVLTDHSLARADFVVTAEERLATRASSTCSLTIGRAKSKLNDARGLHTVPMPTEPLLQGDRLYRRCTNSTPQKQCRRNTYHAFAHHSHCDLSDLASCTLCVPMCPSVARCHLELAGFISADGLFKFETQNLDVLETRATRYSVVVVGWPATHRSGHTPLETDATRMAASRWQL